MKKIILFFLIGILAFPINAQKTQQNLDYLNNARKKIKTGTTLAVVGGGTMVAGGVLYFVGLQDLSEAETFSDAATTLGGIALIGVGEILLDVGIPFIIVGCVQKSKANRRLQMTLVNFRTPNSHTSVNGIGLKFRF
jgi:hypothetical protein